MIEYLNSHSALEKLRLQAEKNDGRGPVAMVVGPKGVGKSSLCRMLLNYAVRLGRRPLYVDTDVGQGALTIAGNIGTVLVERPVSSVNDLSQTAPLIYHFGYKSPSENNALYKTIISKMAVFTLESMNLNKRTKHSGIIINTCGWVEEGGYANLIHIAQAFEVNAIFVLDQEWLYQALLHSILSFVKVVLLPKSEDGYQRSNKLRAYSRDQRIKEYFYGSKTTPFYPFSIEVKFADLKLYEIGAQPDYCKPIRIKGKDKTKLVAVTLSKSLLYHILAVSYAESTKEDVIGSNIAGFVCVANVHMNRQSITILSPLPRPLPNTLLLLSDMQFKAIHA